LVQRLHLRHDLRDVVALATLALALLLALLLLAALALATLFVGLGGLGLLPRLRVGLRHAPTTAAGVPARECEFDPDHLYHTKTSACAPLPLDAYQRIFHLDNLRLQAEQSLNQ
jgi:hypothetical protein